MSRINRHVLGGIGLLIFAIVFFVYSLSYTYVDDIGPGPGFFPVWLSGILAVLSVAYIAQSLKAAQEDDGRSPANGEKRKIGFVVLLMFLFPAMIACFGFLISGAVFLFLLFYRSYKWHVGLGISLATSLFLYWLFGTVLSIPLR